MIMISSTSIFNVNFYVIVSFFFSKLITLGILFSTAVVVAKLVIFGTSPFILFILALREALVAKLVISGILPSMFFILALYKSF